MSLAFSIVLRLSALLVLFALLPRARGALLFSALHEGRWSVYWQQDLTAKPLLVAKTSEFDQTSPAFGRDENIIAFEGSKNEVLVFQRTNTPASWTHTQTITNAVRPTWHAAIDAWVFARFNVTKDGEDSDLFSIASDGLTELLVRHTGNQDYPSITSDGSHLVYTSIQIIAVKGGAIDAYQQLWFVDFKRNRTGLLWSGGRENIDCAWSPSGGLVAFAAGQEEGFEVWTVDLLSRKAQPVTRGSGIKTHPAWSPDGKRIMFTNFHGGKYGLATVSADGGDASPYEPLGPNVQCRDADWR